MNDWKDVLIGRRNVIEEEVVRCSKCKNPWLEIIEICKISSNYQSVISQKPALAKGPFYLLKCNCCGTLIEPNLAFNNQDVSHREYRQMLDQLIPVNE